MMFLNFKQSYISNKNRDILTIIPFKTYTLHFCPKVPNVVTAFWVVPYNFEIGNIILTTNLCNIVKKN